MRIIGHRGASGIERENGLSSFQKAQELGVDMIELDVRASIDNQLVISHDADLNRMFQVNQKISRMTLEALKEVTNGEMLTVSEALSNIKIPIDIHVKVHGIEQQLLEATKGFSSEVLISSTFPGVLKKIRALDENVKLALIIGRGELHLIPIIRFLTRSINLYSIHPSSNLVSAVTVKLLRTLGKKIFVWTINDPAEFKRMKKFKVDGVFTDRPDIIKN